MAFRGVQGSILLPGLQVRAVFMCAGEVEDLSAYKLLKTWAKSGPVWNSGVVSCFLKHGKQAQLMSFAL